MRSRIVGMKIVVMGVLLVGVSATAWAQKPSYVQKTSVPPIRSAVNLDQMQLEAARFLLSGYHAVPTQKELEAAFPNARELMMRIASDPDEFELHRQRAFAALGYWPDLSVYGLYSKQLHARDTSDGLRHQLIGHIVRVFGDAGLAEAASFLRHENVQYRLTAVSVLSLVDSEAAQKYLREAAENEENEVVLERLERATMQVR